MTERSEIGRNLIDRVIEVLCEKFRDKTDRGGQPYIEHLFRVAEDLSRLNSLHESDWVRIKRYMKARQSLIQILNNLNQ